MLLEVGAVENMQQAKEGQETTSLLTLPRSAEPCRSSRGLNRSPRFWLDKETIGHAAQCSLALKTEGVTPMTKLIRSQVVLAVVVCMTSAVSFAQSGDATYKAKCASCHGATGTPSAGMAKMMGIKAVSDPDIQKLTVDQMSAVIKDGKGKMKPISGLTDAQIKDVATYYKGLK